MKFVAAVLLLSLAAPANADQTGNPIQKVLSMIGDLETKIIAEGEQSQKIYDEFSEMCEERSKELSREIETGKADAEDLKATIAKSTADADSESTKIEDLAGAIASDEADLKAATSVREKEAKDFAANDADLMATISALERAVTILEKEMGGASLLQVNNAKNLVQALSVMVDASSLSSADAARLSALVQTSSDSDDSEDDAELGAPAAAVSENKSGGIVETIQGLLEKAQAQLDEARKEESSAANNYAMTKQTLEDKIGYANKDLDKAKKALAVADETKATATGDLDVTTKDLQKDTSSLNGLHHDCMTKASDFELETNSRAEELKAMATAKKIIVEATSLAQVSFVQVAKSSGGGFEAVKVVRHLAQRHHSSALAQLATRMASAVRYSATAGEDPFAKVKGLINSMIEKLLAEAEEDATKKGYCDKEMSETGAKKDDKEAEIEGLSTKIDKATADAAKLKEEVAVLQKELAELASTQAEMDKLRAEEKAAYDEQKPELEKGINGIKLALKVLRDYYAKGDASASSGAGGGIISMLEVAESDFTKGLSEVEATEATAVAEYEDETKGNEVEKATKDQDVKYKTKEAKSLEQAVAEDSSDLSGVKEELAAVDEYFTKIKGECVAKPDPYEEIKKRREEEIAGLKDALETLNAEASLLQRSSSKRTLRGAQLHRSK